MARVGLAVGGAALVLLGGAALAWGQIGGREQTRTVPVDGVSAVELIGGAGSVEVRYAPGARGEVQERISSSWGGGDSRLRVDGGRLVLDTDCGWNCSVDYQVTLPAPVPVTGELGSGDLEVAGMASVDARLGSGGADVRDVAGAVSVETGSGSVSLAGLGGDVDVRTGSGGVDGRDLRGGRFRAELGSGTAAAELTAPQEVDVRTSSGGIELEVPQGAYRVRADTGSGGEEIGVTQDPNAPRSLELSTGSGSIQVVPR
ncbi:putative adhesin [Saccharopolyspora erythraea NRRL 2338]|uniref:Lipoprotein n=2 Tax=Saccharopolyspora erythraea TaxID=1836 RepID=A4FQP4_SACEN|nr:DUF4097 family beta strand repeat-containing protein [Saccharopolyspora erythraea]PFG92971.1 putative adhesin [Saccharopolyspora erythraea NRRL 2338]QRK89863.1 DUF4097 family beta strand repeat protein [Saccharopolyspora erythraea]CAM06369.1 lipoprotein [Saccharopolyspora erythraea NRRL 2338]